MFVKTEENISGQMATKDMACIKSEKCQFLNNQEVDI